MPSDAPRRRGRLRRPRLPRRLPKCGDERTLSLLSQRQALGPLARCLDRAPSLRTDEERFTKLRTTKLFHAARRHEPSRCLRPATRLGLLDVAQPPGFSGRLRAVQTGRRRLAAARPRSLPRWLGKREKGGGCSALSRPCAAYRTLAYFGVSRFRKVCAIVALTCSSSANASEDRVGRHRSGDRMLRDRRRTARASETGTRIPVGGGPAPGGPGS